jgi:hypothetical protein
MTQQQLNEILGRHEQEYLPGLQDRASGSPPGVPFRPELRETPLMGIVFEECDFAGADLADGDVNACPIPPLKRLRCTDIRNPKLASR